METKEVQNMDRYEYCYQLIEDIGETADGIEHTEWKTAEDVYDWWTHFNERHHEKDNESIPLFGMMLDETDT